MSNIHFTDTQKAAIVSLLIEMINVDERIDHSEVSVFNLICAETQVPEDIYNIGRSLNPIVALDIMKRMNDLQKIHTAQLLTRVIDADACDDDREIELFNLICRETGVDVLMDTKS